MYKITYLQNAFDDLDEIYLYISLESIKYADKVIDDITNSIERLSEFPYIGTLAKNNLNLEVDYRFIILKPYIIFYRIIGNEVVIYRILHGKRYYQELL